MRGDVGVFTEVPTFGWPACHADSQVHLNALACEYNAALERCGLNLSHCILPVNRLT
jgi:hypothetical protein